MREWKSNLMEPGDIREFKSGPMARRSGKIINVQEKREKQGFFLKFSIADQVSYSFNSFFGS